MLLQKKRILLVDDDAQGRESVKKLLDLSGYDVVSAQDGQEALDLVRGVASGFDLVVTDVRMPRLGGIEFLRALSICGESVPVILMTAFGRVEDAVWAMKLGAVDFLTKPFKRQTLVSAVEMALKRARPTSAQTLKTSAAASPMDSIVGMSQAIQDLKQQIQQVAPTSATILLTGESGTGKELVSRCVHELSSRKNSRFVAINCAAVPEQLMESELFGYEKGAFTGAVGVKEGLFEAAHGGTLLLDEIGDMPLLLQAKLLRVLQEGEVRRIGATQSRKVDVRVIAATHRDLHEAVARGQFRQDLLFRLEVIALKAPALRDRMEDLPDLAWHFLRVASARHQKSGLAISDEAMELLLRHEWPGNIRELSNVIERAVVFCSSAQIEPKDLPAHLASLITNDSSARPSGATSAAKDATISVKVGTPLKEVEDLMIRKTLEMTSGDKNMTAKLLGINSRTIYRKLDEKEKP